jgi:hypothetical protein
MGWPGAGYPVAELDGRRPRDHRDRGADREGGNAARPRCLSCMSNRHDEIDEELRHLRKLESQLTDQKTLDAIATLIADLEAEKAALQSDNE